MERYYSKYLPDPMVKEDGRYITDESQWGTQKKYLRRLIQTYMYGEWPGKPTSLRAFDTVQTTALNGKALIDSFTLEINGNLQIACNVLRPNTNKKSPVIVFIGESLEYTIEEMLISNGYAIARYDFRAIVPDYRFEWKKGISLEEARKRAYPYLNCGTIMAWAWGASAVVDYISQQPYAGDFIVTGHSRNGKAALCAGIFDERFKVVAPIGSGCGGAGSARFAGTYQGSRQDEHICETVGRINYIFPDWFCEKYHEFGCQTEPLPYEELKSFFPIGDEVNYMPLDANVLRAVCAPNAVFSSEGTEDDWANPFGTQLAYMAAQPVYDFLGIPERNCVHFRLGKHMFGEHDWLALIDYCNIVLHRGRLSPHDDLNMQLFNIDVLEYAPWINRNSVMR